MATHDAGVKVKKPVTVKKDPSLDVIRAYLSNLTPSSKETELAVKALCAMVAK